MSRPGPVARVMIAALAGTIAGIHLDLWSADGYRHIPTIGVLFILNGIAGAFLALTCLAVPSRVLPLAWLATAGYAAATLGAVIISLNGGLFGFTESTSAPLLAPSIGVEVVAILAGAATSVWQLSTRRGHEAERAGHRSRLV